MATLIEQIAEWAIGLQETDIPERVKAKARLQQMSVIAAIAASARHDIGLKILAGLKRWASSGKCTLLPAGKRVDLLAAIYGNAALSLALDYDDYLLFGHTGHSAVCVSLAVAEQEERTTAEALTAQIIANEIEGRLGAAIVIGPHNGQTWSPIHLAGSAAAASRLMGLDARQTAHALAIALYQPPYLLFPGFMGPDSKATTAATPAVTGVQAALLAAAGATGPLSLLEHPQGFLKRFSFVDTSFFISGFGRAWVTDTLAYKIYPGCAYIDTTVDAVLALRQEYEKTAGKALMPEEVTDVRVDATLLTVEMDLLSRTGGSFDPLNPVSINFSIPGNISLALLNGRLTTDDLSEASLRANAGRILELSAKVRLRHDWQLTLDLMAAMDRTLNLRKAVRQIGWRRLLAARNQIRGNYNHPIGLSRDDFRQYAGILFKIALKLPKKLLKKSPATPFSLAGHRPYDLGDCALEQFTMPFASRVTIRTRDGQILTRCQALPLGGPGRDWHETFRLVEEKLTRETGAAFAGQSLET
ncbi:MAG: MmgE/PrpD family protein [Thermodesulfobacteriota bacterium]